MVFVKVGAALHPIGPCVTPLHACAGSIARFGFAGGGIPPSFPDNLQSAIAVAQVISGVQFNDSDILLGSALYVGIDVDLDGNLMFCYINSGSRVSLMNWQCLHDYS